MKLVMEAQTDLEKLLQQMELRLKQYIDEKIEDLDEKIKRRSAHFYDDGCEDCERFLYCGALTAEGCNGENCSDFGKDSCTGKGCWTENERVLNWIEKVVTETKTELKEFREDFEYYLARF